MSTIIPNPGDAGTIVVSSAHGRARGDRVFLDLQTWTADGPAVAPFDRVGGEDGTAGVKIERGPVSNGARGVASSGPVTSTSREEDGSWRWGIHVDGELYADGVGFETEPAALSALWAFVLREWPEEPDPACQVCEGSGVATEATRYQPAERCGCYEREQ